MDPVSSVIGSKTNGPLIAAVARLWIRPTDAVVDVTYGRGKWWVDYRHPGPFTAHDIRTDGVDFRALPEADRSVDVVTMDPPYTAIGGRNTSTVGDFNDRYGLVDAPRTPDELRDMIAAGIKEAARVLRPGGRLLIKTADYISGGKYQPGLHHVTGVAADAGLELVDLFIHNSGFGPQPKQNLDGTPRRQVHSRRAHSYLVVFRAPKRP